MPLILTVFLNVHKFTLKRWYLSKLSAYQKPFSTLMVLGNDDSVSKRGYAHARENF